MNIPGVGEVKNSWVMIGGGTMTLVLGYAYWRNHKQKAADAANAASASAATQYSDTGGAPDDGTNYGGEYYAGYGGIDPTTDIPYAYENYLNYGNTTATGSITTNPQWVTQAEQDAQTLYGATYALAQDAVEKFIAQSPAGLSANEYTIMQAVLAELGQPPTGGPYRLIQASGTTTTTGTGTTTYKSLAAGQVLSVPTQIASFGSVSKVATYFGESVAHLQQANPGLSATATTGQINIPYLVRSGDTVHSIATKFKISDEHLEQILAGQGII